VISPRPSTAALPGSRHHLIAVRNDTPTDIRRANASQGEPGVRTSNQATRIPAGINLALIDL